MKAGPLTTPYIQFVDEFPITTAEFKACYDKFDEEGLKGGVPAADGNFVEGYVYHGNSEQIFREFFGGNNPFSGIILECVLISLVTYILISVLDLFNYDADIHSDGFATFGGLKGRAQPKQDSPIEKDLVLTLEEIFNGAVKKMKISRKVVQMVHSN